MFAKTPDFFGFSFFFHFFYEKFLLNSFQKLQMLFRDFDWELLRRSHQCTVREPEHEHDLLEFLQMLEFDVEFACSAVLDIDV